MPNLTAEFASVRTFSDFQDAFRANPCNGITGNDLVRAWNILATLRTSGSNTATLRYADINISQSSVRTIVSKLNALFRHIGLFSPSQRVQIANVGFYHAEITLADLDLASVSWNTDPAFTRGRRQDRVDTRHENGHRARRNGRVAPLFPPVAAPIPSPMTMVAPSNIANLAALVDGFNAFEGIGSDIFLTLETEAD